MLLADLQKEEAKTLTLLDDESRAVLGLLRQAESEPQQRLPRTTPSHRHRAPLAADLTNRLSKVLSLTPAMRVPLRPCGRKHCDHPS